MAKGRRAAPGGAVLPATLTLGGHQVPGSAAEASQAPVPTSPRFPVLLPSKML